MQIYIVKEGDTVDAIAAAFQIPVDVLLYNNQIPWPYALAIGQALLLPGGPEPSSKPLLSANGYAYPFISPYVLEQTLPYLSRLSVFSYGFTEDGTLIPPLWDDTWMIASAKSKRTAPILTLTPFGPDGQFNNYLITRVINRQQAVDQLINSLLTTIQAKGYEGVDIDFEYILAEDRQAFAAFTARIRQAVNTLGYPVSVALAPKIADNQPGLLYEGKDYALLGAAADTVLLMTYEWGYKYGPAMAVAPLNQVRRVLEYALTRIPAGKIDLGIPNYGYDWTLPFERGVSRAVTIGNVEAVQIAIANNAVIQFDMTSMSPFFTYTQNGREHEVWFEDVRSLSAKYDLIREYSLHGLGCWQIMSLFRPAWLLLDDTFQIEKS